ncbi:MAG: YicC family protein [Bacteroides sp.]|nr:YicC family protein [Bacteroides sp.]
MLLSMTGFGKAVVEVANKKITVEVKSLNSKQLDLSLRLPSAYRDQEAELRTLLSRSLERGKAEASVYVETICDDPSATFNVALLKSYKLRLEEASEAIGVKIPDNYDWLSILLKLPDALRSDAPAEVADEEKKALQSAIVQAVEALTIFRRKEGEKLERFFADRIDRITALLAEVPAYETERVAKIRGRIEEGLSKLAGVDIDRGRLEQEMIYYIEKLDINEEKQRLAQHLNYFTETMHTPQSQGKKLGFISQEMGREINTLGSKSNHAELQKLVVMMKDELEQIKEQVLNVL